MERYLQLSPLFSVLLRSILIQQLLIPLLSTKLDEFLELFHFRRQLSQYRVCFHDNIL